MCMCLLHRHLSAFLQFYLMHIYTHICIKIDVSFNMLSYVLKLYGGENAEEEIKVKMIKRFARVTGVHTETISQAL